TIMTKNALRMSCGDTRGRSGITQSSTTAATATIANAPIGGRMTAERPRTTPKAMDVTAQATIGARGRMTLGAARTASLVSPTAGEATRDSGKRFPMRRVISVELPNGPEAAI